MTVEAAPRRSRKSKTTPEPLAIGEINQTVFSCPSCGRPLTMGTRRCQGCGTRLIIGVQAQRAGILLAIGVFAGLIFGGVLSTTATALGGAIDNTIAAFTATSIPSTSSSTSPSTTGEPSPSLATGSAAAVPALTRSALVQAVAVDERLAAEKASLAHAIKARTLDTYGVSQLLRAISADAVVGLQLSAHVGAWPEGKLLSADMTAFYSAIQESATASLSTSIRNDKAYRASGQKMVALLGGLGALDVRVHDAAAVAGVTFPVETVAP